MSLGGRASATIYYMKKHDLQRTFTVWDKKIRDYEITHYARTNGASKMKFTYLKAENR